MLYNLDNENPVAECYKKIQTITIMDPDDGFNELKEKSVFIPFEKVKQNIIEENKKVFYNNLSNIKNKQFLSYISYEENIYYITSYLKADVIFN